ncbi:hypothetical protein O181_096572 [Austropuccinia psidii MF-1]|uniref:Integrase catalytic domain-containing protein n=1 Tax=Austropuccinia psidii MF-1 TaxID=1389203 RepID=A0A9Q3J6W4_9BASI|nr:hypothetical protein [Austropuccinia psidii MF-1]
MDWVTNLVPGGKENYNACLVIVDRLRKSSSCLECPKEDKAMDTALFFWNKNIAAFVVPKIIISGRDTKFTSKFWTKLYDILLTKLVFSTYGRAERIIHKMEEIIRSFCAYGMEYKDHQGHTITGLHLY